MCNPRVACRMQALADFCCLHDRGLDFAIPLFGSLKGVAPTDANGYAAVHSVVMAVPPLIIEDCSRSYGRRQLDVTFNLVTWNDLDSLKMPPHFQYRVGMDGEFRLLAAQQVLGLNRMQHKTSAAFKQLAARVVCPQNLLLAYRAT